MFEYLAEIFNEYNRIIIFFHILGAMILCGSMIFISIISMQIMKKNPIAEIKFEILLEALKKYRLFVVIIMIVILVTSAFMSVGLGFEYGNPTTYILLQTKRVLWGFITFNFVYMEFKYRNVVNAFAKEEYIEAEENLILIVKYFMPLNVLLSIVSLYFGMILRGQ